MIMEITKEKLIECGFEVFAKYGDNYQMDTFINGSYIRVDFVNGKFRATTDELQRDSFINVPTFKRLNALVYGITGEWLEEKVYTDTDFFNWVTEIKKYKCDQYKDWHSEDGGCVYSEPVLREMYINEVLLGHEK